VSVTIVRWQALRQALSANRAKKAAANVSLVARSNGRDAEVQKVCACQTSRSPLASDRDPRFSFSGSWLANVGG